MIDEAGKQGRADPLPAGDLQRPLLLPRAGQAAGTTPPSPSRARRCHHRPIAKQYGMAIVVPLYEREQAGVYYNTAASSTPTASTSASTARPTSPRPRASGRSTSSSPATSATRCSRPATPPSACTSATTATSPRARARSASTAPRSSSTRRHGRRAQPVPVEARAAGPRDRQRLLRRRDQPRRHRGPVEHRQVLRHLVLREPARPDHRPGQRGQDELSWPTSTST
jgi:hypothetical protein